MGVRAGGTTGALKKSEFSGEKNWVLYIYDLYGRL